MNRASAVNCIERVRPAASSTETTITVGVVGARVAHARIEAPASTPLPISTLRKPNRRSAGVVTVFISRFPAAACCGVSIEGGPATWF
jgi:hypothetical protein